MSIELKHNNLPKLLYLEKDILPHFLEVYPEYTQLVSTEILTEYTCIIVTKDSPVYVSDEGVLRIPMDKFPRIDFSLKALVKSQSEKMNLVEALQSFISSISGETICH